MEAASALFKESGLSNAQAQKLVDFYNSRSMDSAKAAAALINGRLEKDRAALAADPEMGGKLETIKADIGRAYDAVGDPALVAEFKKQMDFSGVGNSPAFVKLFWKMAQAMTEGKHVTGGNPSRLGQSPTGTVQRPSLAEAMYPNLVRH